MMFTTLTSLQVASFWSGLLVLLLVVLSARVVMNRRKHRVLLGDGGLAEMTVATRAFGNAAEYIPAGIGALILLALIGTPAWAVQLVGGAMFIGRLIHPMGIKTTGGVTLPRLVGMVFTLVSLIGAGIILLVQPLLG